MAVTPLLKFNGAPILDLDSRNPYIEVRDAAFAAIDRAVAAHEAKEREVA